MTRIIAIAFATAMAASSASAESEPLCMDHFVSFCGEESGAHAAIDDSHLWDQEVCDLHPYACEAWDY